MAEQAKFLEGNLFRHITVMSLTASIGLMAVFLVDLVDMIFISMLGNAALAAAVGYAGAILFFTTSFAIGMAIAGGALVSRALGRGDEAAARRLTTNSMVFGVILGAVFAGFVWAYLEPLTALVGASGETQDLAITYLAIIVPFMPVMMIGMIGGAVLRAYGDANRAMMATIAAGVVNAVLDPILIFGLGLDLVGAALASVAARITMAVYGVLPILQHHGGLERPTLSGTAMDFRPLFAIAAPAVLTQLATPVGQGYVTRAMAEFGEAAVAGMAVVGRVTPVAFAVIFALSGAVGPIIGQNFGAQKMDRVSGAFRDALIFTGLYVLVVSAILFALRGVIADLFQLEGVGVTLIYLFCGPLALLYFFNGVIFVGNASFNNLGHPFYSTWINWGRHTLGTIPLVILGAWMFGAPGVLIGQAIGGVIFAGVAWALARKVMAKEADPDLPPREPWARQARLLQLFHLRR